MTSTRSPLEILQIAAAHVGLDGAKLPRLQQFLIGVTPENASEALRVATRNSNVLMEDTPKFAGAISLHYWYEECMRHGLEKDADYGFFFRCSLQWGVEQGYFDPKLLTHFDLDRLSACFDVKYDLLSVRAIQNLYDRYVQVDKTTDRHQRIEVPQTFYMRVAMGLCLNEPKDTATDTAIKVWRLYVDRLFCSSTPTLFNSGTTHPQLSSCFLYKIEDSLEGIMGTGVYKASQLIKWAGGLGGSWTAVRGLGSHIRGTNGEAQGVIPFLKIHNDLLIAVSQGSRRNGTGCAYLEVWHCDILDFLQLKKNTGDDRRRTHDMNTACWVPDLFMQRVEQRGTWTLFRSNEVPHLHDLYGDEFEQAYEAAERSAKDGAIWGRVMNALDLWKEMLRSLFETGHPWITFKDACNLCSPQDHCGTVHSSNLCVSGSTRLLTASGYITMRDLWGMHGGHLISGDPMFPMLAAKFSDRFVVNRHGVAVSSPVTRTSESSPVFRVTLTTHQFVDATSHHEFVLEDGKRVKLQDLNVGDRLALSSVRAFGHVHDPVYAELAGMVLGDGSVCTSRGGSQRALVRLWNNDIDEIGEHTTSLLKSNYDTHNTSTDQDPSFEFCGEPQDGFDYIRATVGSTVLGRQLKAEGVVPGNKHHVPPSIWSSDRETVAAFLRGLFSTDGGPQCYGAAGSICCAQKSRTLASEAQLLLTQFGIKSTLHKCRDAGKVWMNNGKGGKSEYNQGELWEVRFSTRENLVLFMGNIRFSQPSKNAIVLNWLEAHPGSNNSKVRYSAEVESIEYIGDEETFCLNEPEDHEIIVNGIVTGNCTEITLNTSADEVAVCNLGSVNVDAHLVSATDGHQSRYSVDYDKLRDTVRTAVRVLDNVIDLNFYPIQEAENANRRHRPIGLGMMGLHDAALRLGIPFDSDDFVKFNHEITERIALFAYEASSDLAAERGSYATYTGSKWSRGLLPVDTADVVLNRRPDAHHYEHALAEKQWGDLRAKIAAQGMRNSNVMAIAPTATISHLMGCSPCIEPNLSNMFVNSNLSGEFIIINSILVDKLKQLGLWSREMFLEIKNNNGDVQDIPNIPPHIKRLFKTAFQIHWEWVIRAASARQRFIDQSQSTNIWMATADLKSLSHCYRMAWRYALKTTYYLRTVGASSIENVTVPTSVDGSTSTTNFAPEEPVEACTLGGECTACQ